MRPELSEDLSDWDVLVAFLPPDWKSLGRQSGALQRTRGFADPERLLRTLLLYLVEGRSLRETALRARQAEWTSVSAVAIWKRLRQAGEWFRLMNEQLIATWPRPAGAAGLAGRRVRLVDGTTVCEPGKTGSSWRIHYAIDLHSLRCDSVWIVDKDSGESFKRFEVEPGDVLVGDRVYANRPGIAHAVSHGGDVVARMVLHNLPLNDTAQRRVDVLRHLRGLRAGHVGEWHWQLPRTGADPPIPVRVCAVKKSATAAAHARKKVLRKAQKGGTYTPSPAALESADYFVVLTTLPASLLPAAEVLELYRARWQIELVFKRLKSILGLGYLPKHEPEGVRAWLQGKLFVATLVETLIAAGETFFPWGYPLRLPAEPLAGDGPHV